MAGILANSASKTMVSGDTAIDKAISGFITSEKITLSTSPAGTTYLWGMSTPSGGSAARASFDDSASATPVFTPDVGGEFVITCTVDSTTSYVIRVSVTQTASSTIAEALRFQKKVDAAVPSPSSSALATFLSNNISSLAIKNALGQVVPLRSGVVGAALADSDSTVVIADGVIRTVAPLTANRIKTLGDTGASTGHVIEIVRTTSEAFTCEVVNGGGGGGSLFTFPASEMHAATFRFDGVDWALQERRKLV